VQFLKTIARDNRTGNTPVIRPYHIQRATIRTPLADATVRLSEAVKLDYMGSAEYEYGALPKSWRRLGAAKENWSLRKVPEILDGEQVLRVFSALSDEEFKEYTDFLILLRTSPAYSVRLKERSEFGLAEREPLVPATPVKGRRRKASSSYERTYADFWWDIDNDVMFSFHKIFMNRVSEHVTASLAYMAEIAKQPV